MREFSVIYSGASIQTLKDMINEFFFVFDIMDKNADDLFYYGVFCDNSVYVNFAHWDEVPKNIEVPDVLTNLCTREYERNEFVQKIIEQIMRGEIEKPEWMFWVEENTICDDYEQGPSTFLRLIPKDEDYATLGEKILAFLYSTNLFTSQMHCD